MKKIIKIVLNLDEVFEGLTHGETYKLITEIKESKYNLMTLKGRTLEIISMNDYLGLPSIEERETIDSINGQLDYVDSNIEVLENALLCHETKIFEKRTIMDMKFNVGLN